MNFSKRIETVRAAAYLLFLSLALCLFHLQVVRGGHYSRLSERNRIRLIPLSAPRGNIFDRNGLLFASNRPAYHVYATPEDFDEGNLPYLSRLLDMPVQEIRSRLLVPRYQQMTSVILKRDLPKAAAIQIEEKKPLLPGVFIKIESIRYYPQGALNGHLLGYIGKISKEEYQTLDRSVFGLHSYLGRFGVEKTFDVLLRGEDGGRQIEVNARGEQLQVLSEKAPLTGKSVTLSLDAELEKQIAGVVNNQRASIVMADLQTGEIIALVSKPDFDPNVFLEGGRDEERVRLLKDKRRPLINRAISGVYPPGSVFKLVTALAALETGKITRYTTFQCSGSFKLTPRSRRFKCWDPGGHGKVDLMKGLERSCNVYFWNVGRLVGEKDLFKYSRMLGLGETVGIEINSSEGLIPNADWKEKQYHDQWYGGDTLSFAIGQGYVQTTPLQILQLVSIIASEGKVPPFSILKETPDGQSGDVMKPKKPMRGFVHSDSFKLIKQGMLQVVESKYGTGQLARLDFMRLAGKTGTAQAPPKKSHSWFVGFFPYENPKVSIVVFVENGGSGGLVAAQFAKQVLQIWRNLYAKDQLFQKPSLPPVKL